MNPRFWAFSTVVGLLLWALIIQGILALVGCTSTVGEETEDHPNAVVSAPPRQTSDQP